MTIAACLALLAVALAPPLAPAPAGAQTAVAAPAPAELKARLDALLAASFPADGPGATMIVTRGGRVVYAGASGLADVQSRTPLTADSVIRLGSITKQFTAAVILQLVGEGKVSLDDPVSRFYRGYPAPGGAATVRQLLNHTSGIQSYTGIPGWMVAANTGRVFTTDQLVAEFRDKPAAFRPGEKWAYNNSGYILLGGIIEKVEGKPWHAAVRDRITGPLRLATIRYGNPPAGPAWATAYSRGPAGVEAAQAIDMSVPQAAGGLVGSVGDLATWARALHHGRVVSPALYRQMIAPTTLADGTTDPYGFGLANGRVRGTATIGHGGGIFGGLTDSLFFPSEDLFVAVFANTDRPPTPIGSVLRRASGIALGRPYPDLATRPADPKALDSLLGLYRGEEPPAVERRFFARGDKLFIRRDGQPESEVLFAGDNRFALANGSLTWFRIAPGANGGLAMELHQNGEDEIERAVRTGPVPVEVAVAVPRPVLQTYVGRYRLSIGETTIAFGTGDALTIQVAGQPALPLDAKSTTEFTVAAVAAEVKLDGRTLTIRQGGGELTGERVD